MKKQIFLFLITGSLLAGCNQNTYVNLEISNPLSIERENEILQFTFDEIEDLIGPFQAGQLPLFLADTDTLTTQFIDYRGDDLPEEMLIQVSLAPKENKTIRVEWTDQARYPVFPDKTSIHFATHESPGDNLKEATRLQTTKTEETSVVYQMEGPAWENENVGFRNYFDLRNGMDIFGKKTGEMVLHNVGLKEGAAAEDNYDYDVSYHEPSDWGMDILKVGNSLGAGAIALEINDSLYRIGDNGKGIYEYLYEGSLKSEFRFSFSDWMAAGKTRNITHYVSIASGKYCYKSTLFIHNDDDDLFFVTGIVNKHSDEVINLTAGENHTAILTHSKQAEDGRYLGMAIMVPNSIFLEHGKTRDTAEGITESYYLKMKTLPANPVEFWFYSFWETTDPAFSDIEKIKEKLNHDALVLENPIIVSSLE